MIRSKKVKYRFTTVTVLQLDLKFSGPVRVLITGLLLFMFSSIKKGGVGGGGGRDYLLIFLQKNRR